MDFSLTGEQCQLGDAAARFVREHYSFEQCRRILRSPAGWSRDNWRHMAEMGWLSVTIPEAYGGPGCSPVETMVLMEAFGRALVPEPYLPTVVMGVELLKRAGGMDQCEELLPAIAAGDLTLAFALAETNSRFNLQHVTMRARKEREGYRLSGEKIAVLQAPCADKLLVTARTGGSEYEAEGISVFLVDHGQQGVTQTDYRTLDGRPASNIGFNGVYVPSTALIGELDHGLTDINSAVDYGIGALVAEAIGCMEVLIDSTTEYIKTRKQFGVPIGSFQALQHRLVDMVIAREHSRSAVYMLTAKLAESEPDARAAASAAKAAIGQRGRFIGGQAIHLHGAMGMTDELAVGDYFKRLMMIDLTFGDANHHRTEFASTVLRHSGAEPDP